MAKFAYLPSGTTHWGVTIITGSTPFGYINVVGASGTLQVNLDLPSVQNFFGFTDPQGLVSVELVTATTETCTRCEPRTVIALNDVTTAGPPTPTSVVEYYDASLDHYFVSSLAPDIQALDTAQFRGWIRTGREFQAWPQSVSGANPVCRFYIPPLFGDSHFLSASPDECLQVRQKFPAFVYESPNVMYTALPSTSGVCPAATVPVYRVWNKRADTNHRYTTDLATRDYMVSKGYVAEGYGPTQVTLCAPQPARLVPLANLAIPVVPGKLTASGNYALLWQFTQGPSVIVPAYFRAGQTLESSVPWHPTQASDPGSGFSGATYTIVDVSATSPLVVSPPTAVQVADLPTVTDAPPGYYSTLLGRMVHEMLVSHVGQPYAGASLPSTIDAYDTAQLFLQSTGSSAEIALADRIAKQILISTFGSRLEAILATGGGKSLQKAGAALWGDARLVVQARALANTIREGAGLLSSNASLASGLLGIGGVLVATATAGAAGGALIAAAGTVAAIGGIVFAGALITSSILDFAAATMVGKVTADDVIPVGRYIVNEGMKRVTGLFTKNLTSAVPGDWACGGAYSTYCNSLVKYGLGRFNKTAAEMARWSDSSTVQAQREIGGIERFVTPTVVSQADAISPPPCPASRPGTGTTGDCSLP